MTIWKFGSKIKIQSFKDSETEAHGAKTKSYYEILLGTKNLNVNMSLN